MGHPRDLARAAAATPVIEIAVFDAGRDEDARVGVQEDALAG